MTITLQAIETVINNGAIGTVYSAKTVGDQVVVTREGDSPSSISIDDTGALDMSKFDSFGFHFWGPSPIAQELLEAAIAKL